MQLGRTLCRRGQSPQALTLTFAGTGRWSKTHRLPGSSAHEDDLRTASYRLMDAAGLQRGRLTALSLRAEELCDADTVAQQITLDHAREARLVAETAVDRVRDKFGAGVIGPAAAYRAAS